MAVVAVSRVTLHHQASSKRSSEWQELLSTALLELVELLTASNTVSAYELQSSGVVPALLILLAPHQHQVCVGGGGGGVTALLILLVSQ